MIPERKRKLLDALWRARTHVEPGSLELAAPQVRAALGDDLWAPPRRMRGYLAALPTGLLSYWLDTERGHLVYTHRPSGYLPGPQPWQGQTLYGLCLLSVEDVALAPLAALEALGALWDHLLGSRGDLQGPWFSDGNGTTPALADAASRFRRIHALGYGHAELDAPDARAYFARTWALYLGDPRRLNVLDPQVFRLFRHTLMNEAWWGRLPSLGPLRGND